MSSLLTPIALEHPASIYFGSGVATEVGTFAGRSGCKRVLVVSDTFNASRVGLLGLPGSFVVFGDVRPEPDLWNLDALLALAEQTKPDLVVGFGGGSAMDLAKLAAVLPGSGQTIHDVAGAEKVIGRRCALAQVPTTSGTGSEAGTRALITDPSTQNKIAVQIRHMLADIAVVDPDLTRTVPAPVTAATGVDALAHCAEAYTSRKAHPLIDQYALEGIRLVGRFLGRAVRDGSDGEARAGLSTGIAVWRLLPWPGEHDGRARRRLSARHAAPHPPRSRLRADLSPHARLQRIRRAGEDGAHYRRAGECRGARGGRRARGRTRLLRIAWH
jgi:alcohol dehydrogenase